MAAAVTVTAPSPFEPRKGKSKEQGSGALGILGGGSRDKGNCRGRHVTFWYRPDGKAENGCEPAFLRPLLLLPDPLQIQG
jgi:hypothetical protein